LYEKKKNLLIDNYFVMSVAIYLVGTQ